MPAKPIFHHERFTAVEGAGVRVQAMRQVCGVHTVCPTIADLGLERSPGEVEPLLVEVGAALVGPQKSRRVAAGYPPPAGTALRYLGAMEYEAHNGHLS
jgi:hypothetical protein